MEGKMDNLVKLHG